MNQIGCRLVEVGCFHQPCTRDRGAEILPNQEQLPRQLSDAVGVGLGVGHQPDRIAERVETFGRARRPAAERALLDLDRFQRREALDDRIGLLDLDELDRALDAACRVRDRLAHLLRGDRADRDHRVDFLLPERVGDVVAQQRT